MPRNLTGGNKSKKGANRIISDKKGIIFADKDQTYGEVTSKLGQCRFDIKMIYDGSRKVGKVKGSMKNRVWINVGDIVLVSLRECNSHDDGTVDILHKYEKDDIRILNQNNELKKLSTQEDNDEDDKIFYDEVEINDDLGPGLVDGSLDDFISNM